jgi:hypothetical protein
MAAFLIGAVLTILVMRYWRVIGLILFALLIVGIASK